MNAPFTNKNTCRLCKKNRKLLKSHIIPEFIYKPLYDELHRFHALSDDKQKNNRQLQKGVRDMLLCSDCETLLSKYERYASSIFNGNKSVFMEKKGNLIFVKGLNYKEFKLFSLSILWRAGISQLHMFSQVQLGHHEEKLRQMILNDDPGCSQDYPFFISPLLHEGKEQPSLIVSPTWTRIDGHYSYRFVFGGMAWIFVVSNHNLPDPLQKAVLSKNGNMTMIEWQLSNMPFIVAFAQELKNQGKLNP